MTHLTKIPFVFITTYSVVTALTNPNPTITNEERRPDYNQSAWYMRIITENLAWIRITYCVAATAEIAVILAGKGYIPSGHAADYTLAILMPEGSLHNLRLTPVALIGVLLAVAGCRLRLKCFRALEELFTFEITIRKGHRLVTHGPYSYVRHPSYTGFLMFHIGLVCWFGSRGSWLRESGVLDIFAIKVFLFLFVMMHVKVVWSVFQRMSEEDKLLQTSFGKEWDQWAQRVPYWLIPGIF